MINDSGNKLQKNDTSPTFGRTLALGISSPSQTELP